MSDSPGTTPTVQRRGYRVPQGLKPIRVQCARCPSKTIRYTKVHTTYLLPQGKTVEGSDKVTYTQYWCLNCLRGANTEEDDMRTIPSINVS